MKTLAGRTPRVLLVAAMSTSALVGATATAGATETCDPGSIDCDAVGTPTTFAPVVSVFTDKVTVIHERTRTVTPVVEPVETVQTVEDDSCFYLRPTLLTALERLLGGVSHHHHHACASPGSAESVSNSDLAVEAVPAIDIEQPAEVRAVAAPETAAELPAREGEVVTPAETTEDSVVETTAETTANSAAEGGVLVEEDVAPEQMEVVGPQNAATGALPQTGSNASVLAMLGLALVASGAAARYAGRD